MRATWWTAHGARCARLSSARWTSSSGWATASRASWRSSRTSCIARRCAEPMPALRKRGPMHEINIVPYVDVMLVLLVIFMVTAPLITPSVIDLPTVEKAGQPRVVPLEVFVKADRGLVVRSRDRSGTIVSERTVSRGELAAAIKEVRGKDSELSVLVGGDKDARYEAVLQVMDELRKQGVTKVGLQVKLAQ